MQAKECAEWDEVRIAAADSAVLDMVAATDTAVMIDGDMEQMKEAAGE